ncbi:MAG TPA: threonine synthase, partial [Actinomycetota bacterium]|nr:threonine synthase [Actinomycetota bacterium]
FAETAGGVTIGVLRKLREAGVVRADESVVAYVTGTGLKTIDALEESVAPTHTVSASLGEFQAQLGA